MNRAHLVRVAILSVILSSILVACTGSNPMHESTEPGIPYGDVNLNEQAYEIADAVLFSSYMLYGSGVFTKDPMMQIATTDCNRDGIPLQLADLQYLIHIIIGDAEPYERLVPDTVRFRNDNGELTIDGSVGSAVVVIDVDAHLLDIAPGINYYCGSDSAYKRFLLEPSREAGRIEGTFMQVTGDVVGVEFSTFEGAPVVIEGW